MSRVEASVDIDVPVRVAYNQWTQFEEFPRFMEGVESVTQLDDKTVQWRAEIGGQEREWTAHITEQQPDTRIVWVATGDVGHSGIVDFQAIDEAHCRVSVTMDYAPSGFVEKVGDMLSVVDRRVAGDLARFKDFIESLDHETGGWRGEIHRTGV
jgi:uncharacterized membrane protein